ncbi:hypothetical protein JAB5_01350 [Janthinobacterium sp. HH103]|uniref:hypothetical protein n=1 Tax=unclassified Janthinobacterium TaxID=2610881 RepID=UPI0008933769|nr:MULTISPECIES: hypothetical protein [unclassified Janthinobacterium]OEZ73164.1 hypothetical protein JAB2_00920 [Janthinobacterium sp. HH100]OEZ73231.1 hypothetical protein JAB2_01590 [Janthinobacterium sp. HH100]OEZ88883.1 hypothetical protein JAB5_01350 [Janthinobacterium sp. HH103]QOU75440.1 hypothetical protein JAB4_049240 [Janthinobacterium sp. HH102]
MSKISRMAAALPFAHLLGMSASAAVEDDDDDKKQRSDESDEDYARRMEDEEEEEKKKEDARRAEEEEKEEKKKEDEARRAKKAEEDEDDKEKAARKSERARCASIFKCAAAGTRPDVAAHLAFNTSMSSADAISMLETFAASGAPQPASLASRMAGVKPQNVGAGAAAAPANGSDAAIAAKIVAAGRARRGEK